MERDKSSNNEYRSTSIHHIPSLEWIASGIGLVLALCMFGFIGWQALDDPTSAPFITVEITGATSVAGGYRVTFRARNMGGAAAAQVRIEGTLTRGSGSTESSDVVFDYIPGHSARAGGLFFAQDPQAGNLSLRATGFASP
jgi:uncharacterized protein (TIGR02588 family)